MQKGNLVAKEARRPPREPAVDISRRPAKGARVSSMFKEW